MKKRIGLLMIALGLLLGFSAFASAKQAKNLSYLMGTYLPALLLVAGGAALRQSGGVQANGAQVAPAATVQERRSSNAETGVIGGVFLMLLGNGIAQFDRDYFLLGLPIAIGGWLLLVCGAANYAAWKGYSTWLGLFGLLLVPGLVVLACLPNRAHRLVEISVDNLGGDNPFRQAPARAASLVGVLIVSTLLIGGLFSTLFISGALRGSYLWSSRENQRWGTLTINAPQLSVDMPDNRTLQDLSTDTPQGRVSGEMHQASDGLATYTVAIVRNLGDAPAFRDASQVERVLNGALDDWVAGLNGSILYRKTTTFGDTDSRELGMEFSSNVVDAQGHPYVARAVGRTLFLRGTLLTLTVVCNKADYDRDPTAMDARVARFFDSLRAE